MWTGEFDFNAPRVDGKISESEKNELRFQKYPDACLRGLNLASYKKDTENPSIEPIRNQGKCTWPLQNTGKRVLERVTIGFWFKL